MEMKMVNYKILKSMKESHIIFIYYSTITYSFINVTIKHNSKINLRIKVTNFCTQMSLDLFS